MVPQNSLFKYTLQRKIYVTHPWRLWNMQLKKKKVKIKGKTNKRKNLLFAKYIMQLYIKIKNKI